MQINTSYNSNLRPVKVAKVQKSYQKLNTGNRASVADDGKVQVRLSLKSQAMLKKAEKLYEDAESDEVRENVIEAAREELKNWNALKDNQYDKIADELLQLL